jgi:hypothetical protein
MSGSVKYSPSVRQCATNADGSGVFLVDEEDCKSVSEVEADCRIVVEPRTSDCDVDGRPASSELIVLVDRVVIGSERVITGASVFEGVVSSKGSDVRVLVARLASGRVIEVDLVVMDVRAVSCRKGVQSMVTQDAGGRTEVLYGTVYVSP